jgi:cytoskeletal protein RodZ
MTINRNNYEEFFLLYADNELSKTERKIVEIFVQENPDLKEEFSMMKLTINSPDKKVTLLDKSFLLKKEPPFINENNYEENFVLYHDDELSEEQKIETEKFIVENPILKTDFELIGKSKLSPEISVVYPGKKRLYRKEKSGKVIPMILWRSLATAVFVGFGLWIIISYLNKSQVHQPVATTVNNGLQKSPEKQTQPDTNIISKKPAKEENGVVSSIKTTEPEKIEQKKKEVEKPALKEQKIKEESIAVNDAKPEKGAAKKIIVTTIDANHQLAVPDQQSQKLTDVIEKVETPIAINSEPTRSNEIKTGAPNAAHAQTVSYVTDAGVNNQNYVFYDVTTDEFNRSKVGGFLKKVKRVVERNNPITRLLTEGDLVTK